MYMFPPHLTAALERFFPFFSSYTNESKALSTCAYPHRDNDTYDGLVFFFADWIHIIMHTDVIVICVSPFDSVVEYPRRRVRKFLCFALEFLLCFGNYRAAAIRSASVRSPKPGFARRFLRSLANSSPATLSTEHLPPRSRKAIFFSCHSNPHASDITSSRALHGSSRLCAHWLVVRMSIRLFADFIRRAATQTSRILAFHRYD